MQRALLCGLFVGLVPCLGFGANEVSSSTYHLVIIGGQSAMNNTRASIAQGPVIEVKDQKNRPVRGAFVTFKSPSSGPSLAFSNGSTQFSTTTGNSGRAVADGLKTNSLPGDFIVLVKASYRGQSIGPIALNEVNVSGGAVELARNFSADTPAANVGNIGGVVLGIAAAPEFKLNGTVVPDNANLMGGNEVGSLDKTVTIDLKDGCDYLIAPNSLVKIADHKLIVENGKVRARHVGTCKLGAGKWTVSGNAPEAGGVVAYSNGNLQVASLNGTLNVGSPGTPVSNVNAGGYATYDGGGQNSPTGGNGTGQTGGASGASAGGPAPATTGATGAHNGPPLVPTTALGVALGGLGLAVDAILQPGSPTPTSP